MSKRKKLVWILGSFVAVIVGARIAAPYLLLDYVNRTLDNLDGYKGQVEDLDLNLWRGAYRIEGVRIVKTGSKLDEPILTLPKTDISVQWDALLDGAIVADIDLYAPEMLFTAAKPDSTAVQATEPKNWQQQVKSLTPVRINRAQVHDGKLRYRNPHSDPNIDVQLTKADVTVENLTNSRELSRSLAASVTVDAVAMGSGDLHVEGRVDPYAQKPTFDMKARLKKLELKNLNDFLRVYANVDVERGTLSVYTELEADQGKLSGYAKPFVDKLKIVRWKQEEEGFFGKLWETAVGGVVELFENQPHDSTATRVPLNGAIESPDTSVWVTLVNVLQHAFLGALDRGLANQRS